MASSFFRPQIIICSLVLIFHIIISPSLAAPSSFKPKSLVLPIAKDNSTLQYITTIKQRTPPVNVKLTIDLGGQFLWVDCDQGQYISSTYKPAHCNSTQCSLADTYACSWECNVPERPGCNNRTCVLLPDNTVFGFIFFYGDVGQDIVWGLHSVSKDGSHPGLKVSVPNFIFTCTGNTDDLVGLAAGVQGMAGLGRTRIALPTQLATAFDFPRKFAICLPSSKRSYGAVFFGEGPYVFRPGVDVSKSLTFTKLIQNPFSTSTFSVQGRPSSEYFINVKSVKVNGKVVSLNTSLLEIDQKGYGGTKISTVNPYTELESTIYKAFVDAFVEELPGHIKRVASVSPFEACFNSKNMSEKNFFGVPVIDFVLSKNEKVKWRVFGANSMVRVSKEVLCLGFVDAALNPIYNVSDSPKASIVIGGHQLEDNLLQFDLGNKRLGFSSSLLSRNTSCANFDFTSIANY